MALFSSVNTSPPIHRFLSPILALASLCAGPAFAITAEQFATLVARSPRPTAATLEAVAADGKTVVAVGTRGGAVKSMDGGQSWAPMSPLINGNRARDMYGIATDGTRFVAIGSGAAVTTDLENWEWSSNFGNFRLGLAYGDGQFIAAGRSATVSVSTDGLEWSTADLPEGTSLEAIAYGEGVWVGAGSNGRIVRSENGTDWIIAKPDNETEGRFRGVSYTNGMFVAGGDKGMLYTSPDGLNWTRPPHESTTNLSDTIYFNEQYVIQDTLSSTQLTTDFLTFERNRTGAFGAPNAIIETEGRLVLVGNSGMLATSDDGVNWNIRRETLGSDFDSLLFAEGLFVMNDQDGNRVYTSSNGAVWTQRHASEYFFASDFAYGNGVFCITTFDGSLRSDDGLTWEAYPFGFKSRSKALRFLNGRFVSVGFNAEVASSPDGITWTEHPTGSEALLQDVNYLNGTYVAVGPEDTILTSPDLVTWTERTSGLETTDAKGFSRIEVHRDQFVLFQGLGIPATSTDGIEWTFIEGSNLRFFAPNTGVDPELGVYTLASGQVIHNPLGNDIGDWDRLSVPVSENFNAIAEGNGVIVGIGRNGLLMSTPLEAGGYAGWATGQFGAAAPANVKGPIADPDGDGLRNLEEYVRGTNPNTASQELRTSVRRGAFGPEITWTQNADIADVQTLVEHSTDMKTWREFGVSFIEANAANGKETFTARVTGDAGIAPEIYIRVRWALLQ